MNGEAVAWLREQITARLETAREACHGGDGHWFRQLRPLYLNHPPVPAGALYEGDPEEDENAVMQGAEIVVYDEGRPSDEQFAHIAANDPQQVIADCEMQLAILDEHYILTKCDRTERYEEYGVITSGMPGGPGDQGMGCVTCHYQGFGAVKGFGICRTVKAVASAYRHHPGYAEHWGEPATR